MAMSDLPIRDSMGGQIADPPNVRIAISLNARLSALPNGRMADQPIH